MRMRRPVLSAGRPSRTRTFSAVRRVPLYVDDDPAQPLEDVLVLRVVDAARRRRIRRGVVAGLLAVLTSGGLAVGLTHRSGAAPSVALRPAVGRTADQAEHAAIYAVARARYATADSTSHRTHLEFGRLIVHGVDARLEVNVLCVPLCGHGEELILRKINGTWQVVALRITWMS